MKNSGLLRYFLGIEVTSSFKVYLLSQSKYKDDFLVHAIEADNKIGDTSPGAKENYTRTDDNSLCWAKIFVQSFLIVFEHKVA